MAVVYTTYVGILKQLVASFENPLLDKVPWEFWPVIYRVPCSIPFGSMPNKQRNLNCLMYTVPNHTTDVGFYNYIEPTIVQLVDIILRYQEKIVREQEETLDIMISALIVSLFVFMLIGIFCLIRLSSKVRKLITIRSVS